jgi:ABC-type transport system involved in cytochrome bd biosynthesis fused ATPase/permease subunit
VKWVTVSENHVTKTTYANGSQRNSDITILWQREQNGIISGKSGSGVVTGSELINGKLINYTGSITVDYSFDSNLWGGWYKSGYNESRVAESLLPKRLPFEVIFIDDMYF